ncbi:DUF2332 domain-containing protein [Nesterenkonia sphaerica]|uniref:DUF2332 domain-containing protein n=1 Tax=Nesterenkonia sphaerica TaxID=1804988 RepID=A0A5R9A2C3_9MICC|nr:DUF2332 domain-containing protein [Nesterenkonia sphaerica]TLP72762.1 DUF2332 domain-containing protein [Nesterenkonia sphaerica]
MQEISTQGIGQVQRLYRHFAGVEAAPVSPLYAEWAAEVAEDRTILELLLTLETSKRQPNLLFAAARIHQVPTAPWEQVRPALISRWKAIRATMQQRRTQTNEAGRLAVLNLAFAKIAAETGRPLALIEVGCSAGLCLYPDAWPIRYIASGETTYLTPSGVLSTTVPLNCELRGVPPPDRLPEVAWRAGVDLNPLDLTDEEDRRWLEALVWPGMEYRLERLRAGARLVAQDPPLLSVGDLSEQLPVLLAQVPEDTIPVVFHSAVLAYLSPRDRERFVQQIRESGVRWVSNEGPTIVPEVAQQLHDEDPARSGFILALDGSPVARSGPHGQYLEALRTASGPAQ